MQIGVYAYHEKDPIFIANDLEADDLTYTETYRPQNVLLGGVMAILASLACFGCIGYGCFRVTKREIRRAEERRRMKYGIAQMSMQEFSEQKDFSKSGIEESDEAPSSDKKKSREEEFAEL